MRLVDLITLIIDNLARRKGRVVLTAIGVVIGTAAVVTLVSLGAGLQKNATSQLWGINDLSSIDVYPGYPMSNSPMQNFTEADIKKLTPAAIEDIQAIPGVTRVVIQEYVQGGTEIKLDKLMAWSSFVGINVDDLSQISLEAREGVTTLDRGQVVIGSSVSMNFYNPNPRPNDPPIEPPELLGKTLKVSLIRWSQDGVETRKTYNLEVVGVLTETKGSSDFNIYLPLDEVNRWNEWVNGRKVDRNKEGYSQLMVKTESPKVVVDVAEQITNLGFQAYTPQSTVEGINSFFTIMQVIFGGVGAIALLVAAIGIANTMTMAILERTREIGIMKAIGATNNNILSIFLGEAAGIGFLGGLGGLLLGWAVCWVINLVAGSYLATQSGGGGTALATVIPFWLPFFSVAFATLVGLLSGLYPALNAATLVPINALKYE